MESFRQEQIAPSSTSPVVQAVIRSLRADVIQRVKDMQGCSSRTVSHCSPPTTLIHVVDIIRNNASLFPEWHSSAIKELFLPKVYENQKKMNIQDLTKQYSNNVNKIEELIKTIEANENDQQKTKIKKE